MFTEITSDNAGQAALSRFGTTNTWNAQQIFKGSATTTPGAIFQAFGTTSAVPAIDANGIAIFQGAEATVGHVQFSASGSTTHVVFRRNNGTYTSPTALAANDIIGSLQWQGRGASTFGTVPAAQIRGVANQAFTEAARGTNLEFYVTANGSITQTLACTMFSTVAAFPILVQATDYSMTKTAGNARSVSFQTSSTNRWGLIANATAEGGTADGSNFEIRRYNNSGTDLGLIMAATRSTGDITFNGGGGITSFAANKIQITTAQTPANSAAAGNAGDIAWDDTYLYVRMSTGWRRIALGAAF
jgi:hypothetical protein